MSRTAPAKVESGRTFWRSSSGMWAGTQFVKAIKAGRGLTAAELRTADVMRDEEWKAFDNQLIVGARERLVGVADLFSAGLTIPLSNGLAKTVLEYDKAGDMEEAIVSMGGESREENDRLEFERAGLPLPIIHKDWYLNLRALLASRTGGDPLDTTYATVAGRKCAEKAEDILFNGSKQFLSLPIYGYTTHPDRNTASFGTNGNWAQAAKTGANVLADVFTGIAALEDDGFFGPYWLYYSGTAAGLKLASDYASNYSQTIRERILSTGRISKITAVDALADNQVIMVQPTSDVVVVVDGETLQTIQWDINGGFVINFKAFQITVPLIRSDPDGNSGVFHMS